MSQYVTHFGLESEIDNVTLNPPKIEIDWIICGWNSEKVIENGGRVEYFSSFYHSWICLDLWNLE